MRILNSCVVLQDSILQTGVYASRSNHPLRCSITRIRKDISAASFCSGKLLERSDECVLLPCFNAQPDIFAAMNCCVVALSLFFSVNLNWSVGLHSAMTHKIRGVDVEKYAYYVNKLRQNVGLETWIWRQIVTSQTAHTKYKWPPYDPERNPLMEIFCVRHWLSCSSFIQISIVRTHVWVKMRRNSSVVRGTPIAQYKSFY